MAFMKWIVVALTVLNAGYMLVDGIKALLTGTYITPSSGEYAGQLGPWTRPVQMLGIDPSSTLMKLIFVGYGAAWLVVMAFFIAGARWAPAAMLALAIGSLWYLWTGTVISLIQVAILLILILRIKPH